MKRMKNSIFGGRNAMKKNSLLLLLLLLMIGLGQCRKRDKDIRWNVDMVFPLAYGELDIYDLLADSLLHVNADESIHLRFETDLLALSLDSLAGMVDTTFEFTYVLPFNLPITLQPGQQIVNNPETNLLNLDGAELRQIVVHKGTVNYRIESTIQGEIRYAYQIPSAKDAQGNIFSKLVVIPKAVNGQKGVYEGSFLLDGYTFDLTGPNQNATNTILTGMLIQLSDNNEGSVTVSNLDTLYIANTLADIQIEKGWGYFGQHNYSLGPESAYFSFFNRLVSGGFKLDQLVAQLTLENGIGVDAFLKVNGLFVRKGLALPVLLQHELIGSQQILNRAYRIGDEVYAQQLTYTLDENTSNIKEMIELMPDSVGYAVEVVVNPLGNVSVFNDFAYRQHPLRLRLAVDMPLNVRAEQLTLVDTLTLEIDNDNPLNDLTLYIDIRNGFSMSANVKLAVLDMQNVVVNEILTPGVIPAGSLDANGRVNNPSNSQHVVKVQPNDMESLQQFKKVRLEVIFDSPQSNHVHIYEDYKLSYTIRARSSVKISVRP
jgi:hypothetical protein